MFSTEHLEGRLRYETDKVVCIDVYSKTKARPFMCQVLLSLVNKTAQFIKCELISEYTSYAFTEEDFIKEVKDGVKQYLQIREDLELD